MLKVEFFFKNDLFLFMNCREMSKNYDKVIIGGFFWTLYYLLYLYHCCFSALYLCCQSQLPVYLFTVGTRKCSIWKKWNNLFWNVNREKIQATYCSNWLSIIVPLGKYSLIIEAHGDSSIFNLHWLIAKEQDVNKVNNFLRRNTLQRHALPFNIMSFPY